MAAGTAVFDDPRTSANWIDGATAIVWDVDVNGDGAEDYTVFLSNFLGVRGDVYAEPSFTKGL